MLKKKTTKFLVSCAIMTLGNATGAFADCAPKCEPKPACAPRPACPPKPCCEPVMCPPMMDDCCKRNVCTPTGMITPRVDMIKGDSMDWFITGDFTYWTAREDNLEFASTASLQATPATEGTQQGQVFNPGNKWKPGFKVGLGTDFCHDGWDVYAEYTWFNSHNSKTTGDYTATTGGTSTPALLDSYWNVNDQSSFDTTGQGVGSAKWHLKMNVVDLELGRNFYVSPRLMLRPFYGLKGTWNKQHMDVSFTNVAATTTLSMDNDIKNWGIGIRTGMDTSWHFSRSFSIIGDLALAGLWEHFKVKRFDTSETISTGATTSSVNFKENYYNVKPVVEWMLGLKWETGLSCHEYHLSIAAAWEEQVWFGQNRFLRVPGNAVGTGGDLSLQGLTVDVRFDF